MPKASDVAEVALLGSYQTDALSGVTIGSQDNHIFAGRVVVEPGSNPLYVVITSHGPAIWQFSGAVDRIERVVLASATTGPNSEDAEQPPLVGATGVSRDRITFLARSDCLTYFTEAPSSGSLQSAATVRNATGKLPQSVATMYSVGSYSIPSGKTDSKSNQQSLLQQKFLGRLTILRDPGKVTNWATLGSARDEMERFFPGGVIEMDASTVVASAPAAKYEVLPSRAGLVQLLEKGLLTETRPEDFNVLGKIRFPAGLYSALNATFRVAKGVPYPDGDPGDSCVIVEETGERGPNCRQR
ncbi:hypothetical protein [Bradyrhizobium arachidis]|uniref:hypothetical protein n=1 Tax=Bradyrhizobium arachidis TaxID=858423 RepID=UPI002163916B|nr:hypothetical protein [Bradyrhizobium arachidis]UVO27376.1 hypothetical protein KUF59_33520 [Bradyrhizobium arachidis]